MSEALNNRFNFPYQSIRTNQGLCDSVTIRISLDSRESWFNGIYHNSRYVIALIFANNQRERDNDNYTFSVASNASGIKVLQVKKPKSGDKILSHVIKQLAKLEA